MPTFGTTARKQQGNFRDTSPTISAQGRAPSDDVGQRNSHLLAIGCETENLYPGLRGENGALKFFAEREIKWWRNTRSGDARDADGPTRNMASSQVACVNFLLPMAGIDGALSTILRAIDSDIKNVIPIEHDGNISPVEFEWIGLGSPLERGAAPTRGANVTSVDAFIVAETDTGRRAYLLEWKYVEEYQTSYLGNGNSGNTRRRRYSDLYAAESSSFNNIAPMDELLYEPFYQLMRQRLLGDRMVNNRELGVSDAKVIAVVPADNTVYRERITSPGLAQRFPNLKTVSEVFRATLKHPDAAYAMICPSVLVDAVAREHGGAAGDWIAYQRERYGL